MKTALSRHLFLVTLAIAAAFASCGARAADPPDPAASPGAAPKSDYQAKLDLIGGQLEAQNSHDSALLTSCNGIADKLLATAGKCTTDLCIVMLAQETGKLRCAGGGTVAAAAAAPPPVAIPDPPPPPVPFWERIGNGIAWGVGKLVDGAIQGLPTFANMKLGIRQSDNARDVAIKQSDNATAATISTNQSFVAMNQGTVTLGQTGFRTQSRTARDAFGAIVAQAQTPAKPTTQITINGDCNGVNVGKGTAAPSCDRTTTTTTTTTTDNSDRSSRTGSP